MKMQLLFFFCAWVGTIGGATTAFTPTTARRLLPRQSCHCHAVHTKSSRAQRSTTKSFAAITVDSSASAAESSDTSSASSIEGSEATPYMEYLDAPSANLASFVPSLGHLTPAEREDLMRKVINGIILTISFGSAIYAILNIDAGMTRGWTQSEIAMRIPLDTWSSYEVSLEEKPVVTKTIINVVIYLLGDWLSQTAFSKKNVLEFDALRTLRNGFIGLCFGPLVVYYYQFSDHILPVDGGMTVRMGKILMDQTLYLTVKCSMYIMAVGVLQGDSVGTAAQNVKDKIKGIIFTAWKFWPLVHCITYSVIPAQHRILWVNMVDLVWNAILATISQKDAPVEEEAQDPAAVALQADLRLLEDALVEETADAVINSNTHDEPFEHDKVPVLEVTAGSSKAEPDKVNVNPLP